MRICIDARSLLEEEPSGVYFFAYHLSKALVKNFPEHTFVFFTNKKKKGKGLLKIPKATNVEIVHKRIPNKLLHLLFSFFGRPRLESLVGECDVYYFPNIHFFPKLPKKSIITLHDISYIQTPDVYSLKSKLWYRLVKARSRIYESDHIIVDSNATRHAVEDVFQKKGETLHVVYPAIPAVLNKEKGRAKHFLLLGDVDERKNIEGALQAYMQVRSEGKTSLPLYVVGKRGYVNLHSHTQELLDTLVKRGWVIEKGYVSQEEKFSLLRDARALLFVSHYEGFGFPGLEAQMFSIPIIASNRSSLPEVLGHGPLYVDPRNRESIAEALRIVSDDSFPHHVAYANPLLKRTWDDVAKEMMNIFNTI